MPIIKCHAFCVSFLMFFIFLRTCVILFMYFGCLVLVLSILFSDSAARPYPLFSHIFLASFFRVEGYISISEPRSSVLALPQFPSVLCPWRYFSRIWFFAKCPPRSSGCSLRRFKSYSTSAHVSRKGSPSNLFRRKQISRRPAACFLCSMTPRHS